MSRTRSGQDLINDVLELTDLTAFTDRHPRANVLRHINEGGAELHDLLIESMGKAYARSPVPYSFTTTDDTIDYPSTLFPSDFLAVISVRLDEPFKEQLSRLAGPEEAFLRTTPSATYPMYYDLIPGGLQIFPKHQAGLTIVMEYVKCYDDVADSSGSLFEGYDGWEQYPTFYAAKQLFIKEGEPEMVRTMDNELALLRERIKRRAPARDKHRANRVRDIRGERLLGWYRR